MSDHLDVTFTCYDDGCPGRVDGVAHTFTLTVPRRPDGTLEMPVEVMGPDCRYPVEPRDVRAALEGAAGDDPVRAVSGLGARLEALRADMAAAAQAVYDGWEQDADGIDEFGYGGGGICDTIAERLAEVIGDAGQCLPGGWDGDDHAWLLVTDGVSAFKVDIPPHVYETGGGMNWTKLPDVTIDPGDVVIFEWEDMSSIADRLTEADW